MAVIPGSGVSAGWDRNAANCSGDIVMLFVIPGLAA